MPNSVFVDLNGYMAIQSKCPTLQTVVDLKIFDLNTFSGFKTSPWVYGNEKSRYLQFTSLFLIPLQCVAPLIIFNPS